MSPNVTKSLCRVFSLFVGILQLQQLIVDMKEIFTKARMCPYRGTPSGTCELVFDPGKLSNIVYSFFENKSKST